MKNFILFLIGIFLILIETFFTNFISSFISVNLILIFVVLISLYIDRYYALIICGLIGTISDVVSGGILGESAVLFLAISYFVSSIEKSIFKDKRSIICILVFISSVAFAFISSLVSALFFATTPILLIIIKAIILIPIINTVVAFFVYTVFEDFLIKLRKKQ